MPESAPSIEPWRRLRHRLAGHRPVRVLVAATAALGMLAIAIPQIASAVSNRNPIGAIDSIVANRDGSFRIAGWAGDPDTSRSTHIEVRSDGAVRLSTYANQSRPDVGAAYPSLGVNRGFSGVFTTTDGTHQICLKVGNYGPGTTVTVDCRTIVVRNSPSGAIQAGLQAPGGVVLGGWAVDPNVSAPVNFHVYVDGRFAAGGSAHGYSAAAAAAFPVSGANHGFTVSVPMAVGTHQICTYALNIGLGANTSLGCLSLSRRVNPIGLFAAATRVGGTSDTLSISGWAVDPDTVSPIAAHVIVDSVDKKTFTANLPNSTVQANYPIYGANHGYSTSIVLGPDEHVVCITAYNYGSGQNTSHGCRRIGTSGATSPSAPPSLGAWPGNARANLSWEPARAVTSAVTTYEITVTPGGRVVKVPGTATSAIVTGLTNGVNYTFSVRAINAFGRGSASTATAAPSIIPPQFTPAPVSTSHYVRNLTGNVTTNAALMRAMGAADASYNPSGHRYLVLLQIGGQDEARQGVLLSATSRFVSYSAVVSAMKAYMDGYASKQKAYAPMTLGIGTNNDVDVSGTAGNSWASKVVNPVLAYAPNHPGITVAGANDIEPGFSATVAQTRAWLTGYLKATSAKYVFNGSADGCSTVVAGSGCNNGWTMSDLQWLGGGAAPTRTINLPQIYNYAMPKQWRYISLTGVNVGKPKLYFGGPLTEVTACDQAGSCGSISNVDAWSKLWSAISAQPQTRQYDMPHGTDLRIN
jgi:hypothetical protein